MTTIYDITFNVSAYCPCKICCGEKKEEEVGKTASDVYAEANHTIAAPRTYKFGTKIELEGYGT